jgi:hypothetical protein
MICATIVCLHPVVWIFALFAICGLAIGIGKGKGYLLLIAILILAVIDYQRGGLWVAGYLIFWTFLLGIGSRLGQKKQLQSK